MAQTTTQEKKGIEFQLSLTVEQYEVLDLLAKLRGKENVQEYIHENMIRGVSAALDHINDYAEGNHAREILASEASSVDMTQRIVLHGFYESDNPGQLEVVAAAAKAMEFPEPKALLEWAAISLAEADLDHMGYFEKAAEMEKTLKEA